MARNLAQLKSECAKNNLTVVQSGRESKGAYEKVLRDFYWNRDFPGQVMPPQLHPMLARNIKDVDGVTADSMWRDPNWVAQEKIDGCRLLMFIGPMGSTFTSRRLSDRTYRYNENTAQLPHLSNFTRKSLVGTVLDGEVICSKAVVNTGAVITRNALQATVALLAMEPNESARIQREQDAWLIYKVFDILHFKGQEIIGYSYMDRLTRLEQVKQELYADPIVRYLEFVETKELDKKEFYEGIVARGGEGIMLKHLHSPYEASSSRTKAMYKVKRFEEFDCFVTGFVPADEAKGWANLIGALEVSAYDSSAHPDFTGFPPKHIVAVPNNLTLEQRIDATACGICGSGVNCVTANEAGKRVVKTVRCGNDHCVNFGKELTPEEITLNSLWLNRVFVVRGQEFTPRVYRLKHAVMVTERHDKAPEDCTVDVAAISAKFEAKGDETGVRL